MIGLFNMNNIQYIELNQQPVHMKKKTQQKTSSMVGSFRMSAESNDMQCIKLNSMWP